MSVLMLWAADYQVNDQTCYGFGRVASVTTMNDSCLGLVANKDDIGWSYPRKLLFHDANTLFVTAMGGWSKNRGQVWRLKFSGAEITEKTLLFSQTDRTHGLAKGPDGQIYFGDATRILRFNPDQNNPEVETVIGDLPDTYRFGRQSMDSNHPLSEFVFLSNGDLVVNVGAPSDDCIEEYREHGVCNQRDEQADLRAYHYNSVTNSYDEHFERIAKGLRNSMGLVYNDTTEEIYQVENAQDHPGTPDEFNVINVHEAEDFGWPFCSGMGDRLQGYSLFRSFCSRQAKKPLFLLPAHASPLDMISYQGEMFPRLRGHLLVSYHGHRPTGSRIAAYATDSLGRPINRNVGPMERPEMIVDGWQKDPRGYHPKGRPVGLATDFNGAIWIIDDRNGALLVLADSSEEALPPEDSDDLPVWNATRVEQELNPVTLNAFDQAFNGPIRQLNCNLCHADVFTPDSKQTLAQLINQGWVSLGKPLGEQTLWKRLNGDGVRIMPPPPARPMNTSQSNVIADFLMHLGSPSGAPD